MLEDILSEDKDLNHPLIAKIVKKIDSIAESFSKNAEDLLSLREKISNKIKKIKEGKRLRAVAIDSSFSYPPLEVVSGNLFLISYGYYSNFSSRDVFGDVVLLDKSEEFIKLICTALERKLAISLLEKKEQGKLEFDAIILDGPINNFTASPFYFYPEESMELIQNLLSLAKTTNTLLIGFIKRVKSKFLSYLLGLEKPMGDKILAGSILERGEYISLGKYGDILQDYGKYLERVKNIIIKKNYEKVKHYKDVEVAILKTNTPVKVEVFGDLEEGLKFLMHQTSMGRLDFPVLLDKVDELVRVSTKDTYYAYTLLFKKLNNTKIIELFKLANPQKLYLFRK
jgi:hypothetical protein